MKLHVMETSGWRSPLSSPTMIDSENQMYVETADQANSHWNCFTILKTH